MISIGLVVDGAQSRKHAYHGASNHPHFVANDVVLFYLQLKTTYEGPGTDQLKAYLGKAQIGDVCQIHIVGKLASPTKRSGFCSCIPPNTEFVDTQHMTRRINLNDQQRLQQRKSRGIV